jgi:hypothetical protein
MWLFFVLAVFPALPGLAKIAINVVGQLSSGTMLCMASVNRFIRRVAIPLVVVTYAGFLWFDHYFNDDPAIRYHLQHVKAGGNVGGLVLGGSNAYYGLSARLLSSYSGVSWYNAAMRNEMHLVIRYNNFIRDLAARVDRNNIRYIVYSTGLPYEFGRITGHRSDKNEKVKGLGIKPKNSFLQYIMKDSGHPDTSAPQPQNGFLQYIMKDRGYSDRSGPDQERRDSYGDLVFSNEFEAAICKLTGKEFHYEREPVDLAVDFLVGQAIFLASVFPYASILVVLPSNYYGPVNFDDSAFERDVRAAFYGVLSRKYGSDTARVRIVFQPPYSSPAQVCNAQDHANEVGRLWRTGNLIDFMR